MINAARKFMKNKLIKVIIIATLQATMFCIATTDYARAGEFLFAGFAFSGDGSQREDLYPWASKFILEKNNSGVNVLDESLASAMKDFSSADISLKYEQSKDIRKGPSVTLAFALGSESVEEVKSKTDVITIYRIMTRVLAFDWDNKRLLASFPLQIVYQDKTDKSPNEQYKEEIFRKLYCDQDFEGNVFKLWRNKLEAIRIKDKYGLYFGVGDVIIGENAAKLLPTEYANTNSYQTQVGQLIESVLSSTHNISLIPYTSGEVIAANMALRFSNAAVLNLKVPKPDYKLNVVIANFKNSEIIEGNIKAIYAAAYIKLTVSIEVDDYKKVYFDNHLKHINSMIFLASEQVEIDYWQAYQTALRTLLVEFSNQINKKEQKVLARMSPDKDLSDDMKELSKIMGKFK